MSIHCHTVRGCTTQPGRSGGRGGHCGSAGEEQVSPVTPAPSQRWYLHHLNGGSASNSTLSPSQRYHVNRKRRIISETCTTISGVSPPIKVSPVTTALPQQWYHPHHSDAIRVSPGHLDLKNGGIVSDSLVSPPWRYHINLRSRITSETCTTTKTVFY